MAFDITQIDDYFFRIINKNLSKNRLIINIYSSKDENELRKSVSDIDFNKVKKFSVYLSNSDLGCFRLCLYNARQYHKGIYDYIQQTFIHLKLQKFIYECLDKLEVNNNTYYCLVGDDNNTLDDKSWNQINYHIDDKERKIEEEPFIRYNNNFKCGYDNNKSIEYVNNELNKFSNELEKLYLYKYKDNKIIFGHTVNNADNDYDIQFYKINLQLKIKNKKYQDNIVLYYCNATIRTFMKTELNKSFHLPVFLTVENDRITEFGTFDKYILAGNYICKIFDYTEQCAKGVNQEKCYGNQYYLIGDRYANIFPLKQLQLQQQQQDQRQAAQEKAAQKKAEREKLQQQKQKQQQLQLQQQQQDQRQAAQEKAAQKKAEREKQQDQRQAVQEKATAVEEEAEVKIEGLKSILITPKNNIGLLRDLIENHFEKIHNIIYILNTK
jgi:hypothetical protein